MHITIIGAGVSGLAAGRALRAVGSDVTIYDASEDIGGVWSAGREYPGLSLQSDKISYAFSDAPMPDAFPTYPSGPQVREYLNDFAAREGLLPHIRLRTRVVRAEQASDGLWTIDLQTPEGPRTTTSEWLIVANGLNSMPYVPDLAGRAEFEQAGGTVLTPSELGDGSMLSGRRVAVLGYGKSAADAVVAAVRTAESTEMVVRAAAWKLPKQVGRVSFQQLLLTRGGEFALWAPYRNSVGRLARIGSRPLRKRFAHWLEHRIRVDCSLERRGLSPTSPITSLTHLTTNGFFDALDRGGAKVHTDVSIAHLSAVGGVPTMHLSNGSSSAADIIVAATGYDQDISFFGPRARAALLDGGDEVVLRRHTIPRALDRVAFVGWAQSFRSPLGAEIQSLWLAAHIAGLTRDGRASHSRMPGHRLTPYRLTHESAGRRGLPLVATGSGFLDLDEWIEEAGCRLAVRVRLLEWVRPLDPSNYRSFLPDVVQRASAARARRDAANARFNRADRSHDLVV